MSFVFVSLRRIGRPEKTCVWCSFTTWSFYQKTEHHKSSGRRGRQFNEPWKTTMCKTRQRIDFETQQYDPHFSQTYATIQWRPENTRKNYYISWRHCNHCGTLQLSATSALVTAFSETWKDQTAMKYLKMFPIVHTMLLNALDQSPEILPSWTWTQSYPNTISIREKQLMKTLQFVLTGFADRSTSLHQRESRHECTYLWNTWFQYCRHLANRLVAWIFNGVRSISSNVHEWIWMWVYGLHQLSDTSTVWVTICTAKNG